MNTKTTFSLLLKRLYKWRIAIIIGTGVAFIVTCIVVLLLPVYYKAQTTFYAASQDLTSPESIFGDSRSKMEYFGTNQDEDRIIAIAKSRAMLDFLVDSFQLFTYYDIDPDGSSANFAMYNKLMSRYKLTRTENDGIHIQFIDKSPTFTAAVANSATRKLKALGVQEIKNSQQQIINSYMDYINSRKDLLYTLQDSMARLKKEYNIVDTKTQAESLASTLSSTQSKVIEYQERVISFKNNAQRDSVRKYSSILDGLRKKLEVMESDSITSSLNIARFSEGSEKIFNCQQEIISLTNSQNETKKKLNYLQSVYESETPSIHVIEYADVPEVKYWPSRTILVLGVTLLVFFLLCFLALIREGFNTINWKEITHGGD